MARSRNIKPGFFKNEVLPDVAFQGRLMFIGLWTLADREGRLEYRPRRIKGELFPYEECDVEAFVKSLESTGFLQTYEVDGTQYIQILNFQKHQNPHHKEAESLIPAPDKPSASTRQAPTKASASRADSLNLIPDSLNPIDGGDEPPEVENIPAGVDKKLWETFLQHRYECGKRLTVTQEKELHRSIKELVADGIDPNEQIKKSIASGWTGVFKPTGGSNGTHKQSGKPETNAQRLARHTAGAFD